MARQRVSTGVPELDAMTGGGFKQGKTYLISGETGTGKTLFSLQYILDGIKKGEAGVYVTIDEKSGDIIDDAESLGWDLRECMNAGMLSLLDITPQFTRFRSGEKRRRGTSITETIPSLIGNLSTHIGEIDAKRLVLDPIAPLIAQTESEVVIKEYIRGLIFALDETLGVTTLCTSEIPTGTRRLSWYGVEEFIVSGVIALGLERTGSTFSKVVYVRKMRGSKIDMSIYTYDVQVGKGIVVTPITLMGQRRLSE